MSSTENAHSDIDLTATDVLQNEILSSLLPAENKQSDTNNEDQQSLTNNPSESIGKSADQTTEPLFTSDFEPNSNGSKIQSETEQKESTITTGNENETETEDLSAKNEEEEQNSKENSNEIDQSSSILRSVDFQHSNSQHESESNVEKNETGQPLRNQLESITEKLESGATTTIVDASSQTDPLPISVSCQTSFPNSEAEIIESTQENRTISESNLKDEDEEINSGKRNSNMEKQAAIFNSRCSQSRKFDRTLSNRNSSLNRSSGMYNKPRKTAHLNKTNTTPPRDKNRHLNFEISQSFSPQLFTSSPRSSATSSGRQNEISKSGLPIISMKGLSSQKKNRSSLSSLLAEPLNSSKSEKPHYSTKNNKLSPIKSNVSSTRSCVIKTKAVPEANKPLLSSKSKKTNNEGQLDQTIDMLTQNLLPDNKSSSKSSSRNSNENNQTPKDTNIQKDDDNDVIVFDGGGTTKELADDMAKVLQPLCVSNSFEEDKNEFDPKIVKKLDSHGNTTEINFTDNESQDSEVSSGHQARELSEIPDLSKITEEEEVQSKTFEEEEELNEEQRKEKMVDDLLNYIFPEPSERASLMSYLRTTQINAFLNEDYQNAERLKIAESILQNPQTRSRSIEDHYASIDDRLSKAEENLNMLEDEYKNKLAQFEEDRAKANVELEKNQQEEIENFENQWDSEKAMLKYQKASPHLLELRFRQKRLALAKEYQYANEIKLQADELQDDETQDAASNASEGLRIAYAQMMEKHQNQKFCFDNKWERHRLELEAKRDEDIQRQQRVIDQLKNKKYEKYDRRARCHIFTDRVYESTPVSPRTKNSLNIYRRDIPISRLKLNSSTIVQRSLHPKKQRQKPFTPGTTKRYGGYC